MVIIMSRMHFCQARRVLVSVVTNVRHVCSLLAESNVPWNDFAVSFPRIKIKTNGFSMCWCVLLDIQLFVDNKVRRWVYLFFFPYSFVFSKSQILKMLKLHTVQGTHWEIELQANRIDFINNAWVWNIIQLVFYAIMNSIDQFYSMSTA